MRGGTRTRLKPPPGGKAVKDWTGKRVETLRPTANNYGQLPAGARGTVEWNFPHGLKFRGDPCAGCGVSMTMGGLTHNDVRVLDGEVVA